MTDTDILVEISRAMGRVEEKVNAIHESHSETKDDLGEVCDRVTSLEHTRTKSLGFIAGASAIIGAGTSWLVTSLTGGHQ